MKAPTYFLYSFFFLLFAYIVFRFLVRNAYASRGRLTPVSSGLQLLVFIGFFILPYQFNPPEWIWFWTVGTSSSPLLHITGLIVICAGFVVAFGTMAWFGIRRAFGVQVDGLKKVGPYSISRNPQIMGGYLLVIGTTMQSPSLYAVGWIAIYAVIANWMVMTEEEHLHRVFGDEYKEYCKEVPRYIFK